MIKNKDTKLSETASFYSVLTLKKDAEKTRVKASHLHAIGLTILTRTKTIKFSKIWLRAEVFDSQHRALFPGIKKI